MNDVIDAIKALLSEATGAPVWVADATPAKAWPYTLLLPPGFASTDEIALDGDHGSVDDQLMVRPVALKIDSLLALQTRTRRALSDADRPLNLTTAEHKVTLIRGGALDVTVDRDVTNTITNTHPVFVTDFYTLAVEPLLARRY